MLLIFNMSHAEMTGNGDFFFSYDLMTKEKVGKHFKVWCR